MDKYENIVPFDTKNAKSPRFNFDDFIKRTFEEKTF